MGNPTSSDIHVNRPLTNVSIAYLQDQSEFIAAKVFPTIPVEKKSDLYYVYPKDSWFRNDAVQRAPGTESAGTGYDVSTDSYSIGDPFALHQDVPDPLRENQDAPLDLDRDASLLVTQKLLLNREIKWAAKYFTTGIWSGAADATPTTKWNASSSIPIATIRATMLAIKQKTGFKPNTIVLAENAWMALQDNADFLDRIKLSEDKVVTVDLLARLLEVRNVFIGGAVKNTAAEGATAAMASVFDEACLVCYAAPSPSIMMPTAGYTFAQKSLFGAGKDGLRIKRFRMEPIASDRIEGELAFDQKLVAADLGAFIYNVLT